MVGLSQQYSGFQFVSKAVLSIDHKICLIFQVLRAIGGNAGGPSDRCLEVAPSAAHAVTSPFRIIRSLKNSILFLIPGFQTFLLFFPDPTKYGDVASLSIVSITEVALSLPAAASVRSTLQNKRATIIST